MVESVQSFRTSDNQLFDTQLKALCHEVRLKLLQITGGNAGIVDTVLSNREVFWTEMQALIAYEQESSNG